ncbi:hypothetical protein ACFL2T_00350 [Elusimicrobiota bacterium]
MLRILEDEKEILRAQRLFARNIKSAADATIKSNVGYQGGNDDIVAHWSEGLQFWSGFRTIDDEGEGRYWNSLGTTRPRPGGQVPITCEINSPLSGINRFDAGAFATDDAGELYLLHRGRIGGGRKGVGKSLFFRHYNGKFVLVEDADRQTEIALVGHLDSPHLPKQVANFAYEVQRIKGLVGSREDQSARQRETRYRDEFAGRREYEISRRISAECNHGLVVRALRGEVEQLLRQGGLRAYNDNRRDLFAVEDRTGVLRFLFEVKTAADTTSRYTAVGQLMYHSAGSSPKPKLVAVLPRELPSGARSIITSLGIRIVTFTLEDSTVRFASLTEALRA